MNAYIETMRTKATELGLTVVVCPANSSIVIFNLARMDEGAMQIKASGEVLAAWDERTWGPVRQDEADNVLKILAA